MHIQHMQSTESPAETTYVFTIAKKSSEMSVQPEVRNTNLDKARKCNVQCQRKWMQRLATIADIIDKKLD